MFENLHLSTIRINPPIRIHILLLRIYHPLIIKPPPQVTQTKCRKKVYGVFLIHVYRYIHPLCTTTQSFIRFRMCSFYFIYLDRWEMRWGISIVVCWRNLLFFSMTFQWQKFSHIMCTMVYQITKPDGIWNEMQREIIIFRWCCDDDDDDGDVSCYRVKRWTFERHRK